MSDFNDDDSADLEKTSVISSDTFKLRIAEAGNAPPSIVLLVGPANAVGRQWPIENTDYIIGRSISAHVSIDDGSVSKSHAKLSLEGGTVSIVDLESTNKTIVNGNVLLPLSPKRLENHDQVKLGNIIFKFLERGNIETVSTAQTFDKANIDPLTQISNKGALEYKGIEYFKKSQLLDTPFSIITFDIDHFKKVNDTYGHSAGDYILKEVASDINKLIRGNDFFARSGGEEFTAILLGGDCKQASDIAERMRTTIAGRDFNFQGTSIPITVSLGVSTKSKKDHSWLDVFDRADQALYMSKKAGRNQVNIIDS